MKNREIAAAKAQFESFPVVGAFRLHNEKSQKTVRRMPNGKFGYFREYAGHHQIFPVSAGEVLHHLIKAADWPRKKSEFTGIAGFQQTPTGTFKGGSFNDKRSYEFDYRVAPDGRVLTLHTCRTYIDVYRLSDAEASEAVAKYFGV